MRRKLFGFCGKVANNGNKGKGKEDFMSWFNQNKADLTRQNGWLGNSLLADCPRTNPAVF